MAIEDGSKIAGGGGWSLALG